MDARTHIHASLYQCKGLTSDTVWFALNMKIAHKLQVTFLPLQLRVKDGGRQY